MPPSSRAAVPPVAARRIVALDAARGLLALTVLASHIAMAFGSQMLHGAGQGAVYGFFLMSGYVLAAGYDGRPAIFILRRLIRLWPVYAACLITGAALSKTWPGWAPLVWWPPMPATVPAVDPPAWTLYLEAWATLFLPPMIALARWNRWAGLAMAAACLGPYLVQHRLGFIFLFATGVAASRFPIHFPTRIPRPAAWLGEISYSLYLSHWIIMWQARLVLGPWGAVVSLPAVFATAWLVWRYVEKPSIAWSRAAGRRLIGQAGRTLAA